MSDARGFDPRYSPEFQRGYTPPGRETQTEQPERLDLRRERTTRPHISPVPVTPISDPPRGPEQPRDAAESVDGLSDEDHDESEETIEAPLWRNPYLITLAVLGVVLTFGGVGLFRWAVDQVYAGQFMGGTVSEGRESWLWVQVAWGIAPLLAIAGALTVLGIFFFLATRWKPRRHDVDDDDVDGLEE